MKVESYLAGRWVFGTGDDSELWRDPATAEVVSETNVSGLDFSAAFEHARTVGHEAHSDLTFHDRAGQLRACAKLLDAQKDGLYELSSKTGATGSDSWIDIDGGLGTLFAYASRGNNALPNAKIAVDGDVETISRDGSFVAQHIYTRRQGVALHINAYNFPVWGMLEKFAPAHLAGMPVIVKAAEQTAFLAERVVRMLIDSQELPQGALQLVSGPAHSILDHVRSQDVIAFTGSSSTARQVLQHPRVLSERPRVSTETDSINCTILGPDAVVGSIESDLFVAEVVKELSSKAGQKCTAIRRVLVPAAVAEEVSQALQDRLGKVSVGNPRSEDVQMGPLVSLRHRRKVLDAIETLARVCDVILDGRKISNIVDADPNTGAFLGPTLLRARDAHEPSVHSVEAFGPVCTLLEYTPDELSGIVKAGGGALVGSIFSADEEFVSGLVPDLAPHHGRLLVVNRSNAENSTGHGSPLPTLVHGGPGRAGESEELGGVRGVFHYMQRTAIQGTPATLAGVTGRWVKGADIHEPHVHPFKIPFHDLTIGTTFHSVEREVTLEDIEAFARLTGDVFYAHMDEEAARRNPLFGGRVAHGYFLVSAAAGLFVDPPYGPVLANYGIDGLRFTKPVKPGARIKVRLACKSKSLRKGRGYGEVAWDTEITDQDGEVCARYDVLTMVSELAVPDADRST